MNLAPEFFKRPTHAKIRLDFLAHNFRQLESLLASGQEIVPVVKANAYGHGMKTVAEALFAIGLKRFAVATFEEGAELHSYLPSVDILILNGLMAPLAAYADNQLKPIVHSLAEWQSVLKFNSTSNLTLHYGVKFDTGMGRLGILPEELADALSLCAKYPQLLPECVLSHLSSSDVAAEMTLGPRAAFQKICQAFKKIAPQKIKFSLVNSAGLMNHYADETDWMRLGIALYGIYPNKNLYKVVDLKPVLEWQTQIIELKTIPAGHSVGYGETFRATRATRLAIVPLGYADGFPRLASNRGCMLVRGQRVPVIGRVSMDLTALDVTDVAGVLCGDDVVMIGSQGTESIHVDEVASWAETISYEILTKIMPRVHRIYIK